jgi:hypothetical protein
MDEKKPSTIALNTLNIIMIIPILSIYALKDESRLYVYFIALSFLLTLYLCKNIPRIKNTLNLSSNSLVYSIVAVFTFIVYGLMVYFNGIPSLELFDLSKVYTIRGTVDYGFGFMDYLVGWQAKIINVFFITMFWVKKKKKLFIASVALQIFLFLITSHKAYFFYPILLPFIMFFIKRNKFNIYSLVGLTSITWVSLLIHFLGVNKLIAAMFVNRTLFLPAQISFQYHEFFSKNGLVMLSHSIFGFLFKQPIYEIHPIRVIGINYYTNNWPNTGYLADAFMNFGYLGMIIFSIIFAFILKLIDSLSYSPGKRLITSGMMVFFMISFTNGALLTNLLNGGVLFFILFLLLFKDNS